LVGWQDPVLTQPDTLMMIEHKEYMGVQVPIYHFKQPGRINPNQLPFRLGTSALIRPISRLLGSFYFPRLIVCRNNSPNPICGSDWSSRRACWRTIRKRLLVNPKLATCFTSTKVQVLTPRPPGFLIPSLLHALLVQEYKY
jgi:hypothetical protein